MAPFVAESEMLQPEVVDESGNGRSVRDRFLDAQDELAHWEREYLVFLRTYPVGLRRALPLYHEHYKHLTHRLVRAECRYLERRDAVVSAGIATPKFYALTEGRIERVRAVYVETHRALTQPNYDPTKVPGATTGAVIPLNEAQFDEWVNDDRATRNEIFAELAENEVDEV
jgi:hypothetical protein